MVQIARAYPSLITPAQDYAAGGYYPSNIPGNTVALVAGNVAADIIYFTPFRCTFGHTFTGIAFGNQNSINTNKFRLGIYSTTTRRPDARIVDSGELTVSDASTNLIRNIAISQALNAETLYWLAYIGNATSNLWNWGSGGSNALADEIGTTTGTISTGGLAVVGFSMSQAYGALPATASSLVSVAPGTIPVLQLKG